MQRLTGLDALFFYGETPAIHLHTLKISFLKPAGEYDFEQTKINVEKRLHLMPPFHWRKIDTPFGLHHPVWIEDPDFDFEYHIRRMAVPAPYTDRELCELISEIVSRPLDHSKPLWQIWLIEGLASGEIVSVAKVHHAIADGVSSAELLLNYYTTEPQDGRVETLPQMKQAEPVPSWGRLLFSALKDVAHDIVTRLPALIRTLRASRKCRRAAGNKDLEKLPGLGEAPVTLFNKPLTPHRRFAYRSVSLEDVRYIRKVFGVTINDVLMAVVSGAVRRYLLERNGLPEAPLLAGMPASTRTEEQRNTWGNRLANIVVPLATDIADPVERLMKTHEFTGLAKRELEISRGTRLEDWIEVFPPFAIRLLNAVFARQVRKGGSPLYNLVVSNVPGPRQKLYGFQSEVANFVSVGPLTEGIGLNVTMWSYVDKINFALLSCKETVPDLWAFAGDIEQALEELLSAARIHEQRSA